MAGCVTIVYDRGMASVKMQGKNSNWYLCYKEPTGEKGPNGRAIFKRVQKWSEFCGKHEKAKALKRALDFEVIVNAVETKEFNDALARDFILNVAKQAKVNVGHVETPRMLLEKWKKSRKLIVASKTALNYDGIIKNFLTHVEERKLTSVAEITNPVVTEFRDLEIKRGKSVASINKSLSVLGQALEVAVVTGALPRNPVRGLRLSKLAGRKKAEKRQALSFKQFAKLVQAVHPEKESKRGHLLNPDWQTFVLILGYTGGRQQEVAKLKWEDVNFTKGFISLARSKTSDVHKVPIHPALRRHLEVRKKDENATYGPIFSYIGQQTGRALSKHFREIVLPRIGIRQPYNKRAPESDLSEPGLPQVGRVAAAYSLHSLRHSLSSWLNAEGVKEMTRMRVVGHEDIDTSRDYTHEEMEQMQEAIETLPDVFAERG